MPKKVMFAVALAALLVPAAALAKSVEVQGPASLAGRGGVRGALHGEEPGTVQVRMTRGQLRVVGAAGDLEVTCEGRSVKQGSRSNGRLETVLCVSRGPMTASITSKRFRLGLQARAFSIQVPEGLSGTLHGNLRLLQG